MNWERQQREVPDWFRDAKFGLFFHWGPYCVPAYKNEWYSRNMYKEGIAQHQYHVENYGEISDFGYKDFYQDFTGENFDPRDWADLVVRSGAKYAGPVSEHADNFSLWDSDINPVNSVNYGPGRDVVGELEQAIRARGINFITTFHHQWLWGWFMSTNPEADVYIPKNEKFYGKALPLETNRYQPWRFPDDEFNERWLQKVVEVIDNYSPDLIYFDSRAHIIAEEYKYRLLDYYYNGPGSNSRNIISYKQQDFPRGTGLQDIECGQISGIKEKPWQVDDRLEAKKTWCYVENPCYKTARQIIHQLCDTVSKNGNLLLNVGPRVDGTFASGAVKILKKVGDWLALNGEAIYGTRPYKVCGEGETKNNRKNFDVNQIKEQTKNGLLSEDEQEEMTAADIRFTTRNNNLYAIIMGVPDYSRLDIYSLGADKENTSREIVSIDIIGGRRNLDWQLGEDLLTVNLKGELPSEIANVLKITYRK